MDRPDPPLFRTIDAHPLGGITVGWKPASPGVPRRRVFPHHVLILTAGGEADFADDAGRRATLRPGDVLALFPGLGHTFAPAPGARWDELFIIFSGPAFVAWSGPGLLEPEHPVRHVEPVGYWLSRFRAIAEGTDEPPHFPSVARLHVLIADLLAQACSQNRSPADRAWLAQAGALLDAEGSPSLHLVARRLGCSEQVFRKRFRALAGAPPAAWRDRRRLDRACELLRSLPVAEVAARLGYCDAFHFSRRFRHRFGVPPREYRRAIAG